MKATRVEHIGIAVRNLEESIRLYETLLGVACYAIEEVKDQKVRTAFFRVGETKVELLASTSPDGPIGKFIDRRGEGVHHVAFSVDGVASSLRELEKKGFQLIDNESRQGAEGLHIAFVHPRSANGVLVELCERSAGDHESQLSRK